MTIAAFIPTIWSARYTDKLRNQLVWGGRCNTNYMGEIRGVGNKVVIPTGTTNITVKDYVIGTNIDDPEKNTGTTTELVIDKQKYFHYLVDNVDMVQHKPELMDEASAESAYQMSLQIDNDVRAEFNKAYDSNRSVRVTEDLTADDAVNKIIAGFIELKRKMTIANLPSQDRWVVVHPDLISLLDNHFANKNASGLYLPMTSESTLTNGFAGTLVGFRLYTTNLIPEISAASKNYWRVYAGQGMSAVTYASQIIETKAYMPERQFADAVKGLQVYGIKLVHPERLFTLEHQKVA